MTISRLCSDSVLQKLWKPDGPRLTVLILACALGVPAFSEADSRARDAALCSSLTQGARTAFSLGYISEASTLLDEALSFLPSNPDARYYRALVGLALGEAPATALVNLETAMAGGAFNLVKKDEARLLYATLLAQSRRSGEALRFLSTLQPSAQSLYVETKALLSLGDETRAGTTVLSSLLRYPLDARALLAWLRWRDRPYVSAEGSTLVSAGFKVLDTVKELDPDLLIALAPYAGSPDATRLLIREFRAMGNKSADATILALKNGLISESRAISELLSGDYIPTILSLRVLESLLSSDESRNMFANSFKGYSGTILNDEDRDDFPESATVYKMGLPATWVLDQNQDGVPEIDAVFVDGVPTALTAIYGTTTIRIRYSVWPFASSLEYSDTTGNRNYSIGAGVLPLSLLDLPAIGKGFPVRVVVRSKVALPLETTVVSSAFAVSNSTAMLSQSLELFDGTPTRAWWSNTSGQTGYLVYREGVPDDEVLDMDGDGRFEARRVWTRGTNGLPEPAYIEADLDDDGLFEYRESLQSPWIKSWDQDGDGKFDISLEKRDDGAQVHRSMAGEDPLRWVEVVYTDGRIESATEGGTRVQLVADSGGQVTWVGNKPFDFGAVKPEPGYGSRNGVRYIIALIGGSLYAQTLP